jgi:hypothetical protein
VNLNPTTSRLLDAWRAADRAAEHAKLAAESAALAAEVARQVAMEALALQGSSGAASDAAKAAYIDRQDEQRGAA